MINSRTTVFVSKNMKRNEELYLHYSNSLFVEFNQHNNMLSFKDIFDNIFVFCVIDSYKLKSFTIDNLILNNIVLNNKKFMKNICPMVSSHGNIIEVEDAMIYKQWSSIFEVNYETK